MQNRVLVGDRVASIRAELAVVDAQRDICPPDGARTPATAPPVRSSTLAWTPRRPALNQRPSILLLLSLSRARSGGNAVAIAAESFASSSRPRLCVLLRLRAPPSPPRAPPSSPPISWTRSPRGERHFASSPSSGSRPSRHRFRRTSPLLHPRFLSSLWLALGYA